MWMMVMFDLPVVTATERKQATNFRKTLLDMGFSMSQYSVYFRFCGTREQTGPFVTKIKRIVLPKGRVSILLFTDKQFGDIINFTNLKQEKMPEQPTFFDLF